ncbi:cutinase family protein [Nocardia ignorata]|uniref:Cutinase n=1 Tax=Nocardia ignorata TaxID=145285 RepID=A0A4R6P3B1_NOCIG|nr:cutinase family protein [Nocardia ignorata]TDP29781.1 cutinase [Nocardia ignorata]
MYTGTRLAATLISAATVFTLGPLVFATGTASAAPDCRPIVIGVGGNGERYADSKGAATVMGEILADQAAQGNRVVEADYTSSVWPTGPWVKDYSVLDGRAALDREIATYRAECPNGHVTVIGHSLGAEVIDHPAADRTIVLGDPRTSNGIYSALPGVFPGAANPGPRDAAADGVVSVCREFDAICDSPAPWSDPAKFVQGVAGFLGGYHGISTDEVNQYADAEPGEYMIDAPPPIPWLPESTPTGIPEAPAWSLPELPIPAPLPSAEDFYPLEQLGQPYQPTPLAEYVPEWVEPVAPQEVLAYVPPPLPVIELPPAPALPPLPDLGIRLP